MLNILLFYSYGIFGHGDKYLNKLHKVENIIGGDKYLNKLHKVENIIIGLTK